MIINSKINKLNFPNGILLYQLHKVETIGYNNK